MLHVLAAHQFHQRQAQQRREQVGAAVFGGHHQAAHFPAVAAQDGGIGDQVGPEALGERQAVAGGNEADGGDGFTAAHQRHHHARVVLVVLQGGQAGVEQVLRLEVRQIAQVGDAHAVGARGQHEGAQRVGHLPGRDAGRGPRDDGLSGGVGAGRGRGDGGEGLEQVHGVSPNEKR